MQISSNGTISNSVNYRISTSTNGTNATSTLDHHGVVDAPQSVQLSNGNAAFTGMTNVNGGGITNGHSESDLGRVKKEELVRLLVQSLGDLGYSHAACVLEKESGVALESEAAAAFRRSVLAGDWHDVEARLPSLPLVDTANLSHCQFLVRCQKFLELLEANKTMKALYVLRNELTPVCSNVQTLHQLSSLIFCSSIKDVKAQCQWDGANGNSRQQLLFDLQHYIIPSFMLPNQRLLTLINQSMDWQIRECLYHTSSNIDFSLFSNHTCDRNQFPSKTHHILEGHTDEVWHIAFSNNGRYLASVSKDSTCIIWDMKTFEKIQVLSVADEGSSYCAWSPDDSKLLMCGCNSSLRLWDPMTGELLKTYNEHSDQVTSSAWLPDGQHFISGAFDESLILRHVDGTVLHKRKGHRILDIKIASDGRRVVTTTYSHSILIYSLENMKLVETGCIEEPEFITSLTISADGRFALVNIQEPHELHLWNLDEQVMVHTYTGHKQGSYIIRSTLGGADQSFVLSGSEDNNVYVWSLEHSTLLEVLKGHRGIVNCVSWSPMEPAVFASASDDKTIRIWGLPNLKQASTSLEKEENGMVLV